MAEQGPGSIPATRRISTALPSSQALTSATCTLIGGWLRQIDALRRIDNEIRSRT